MKIVWIYFLVDFWLRLSHLKRLFGSHYMIFAKSRCKFTQTIGFCFWTFCCCWEISLLHKCHHKHQVWLGSWNKNQCLFVHSILQLNFFRINFSSTISWNFGVSAHENEISETILWINDFFSFWNVMDFPWKCWTEQVCKRACGGSCKSMLKPILFRHNIFPVVYFVVQLP